MSRRYGRDPQADTLLGVHLQVADTVVGNTLPLTPKRLRHLMRCLGTIEKQYEEEQGLPMRSLYAAFEQGQLMVLCFRKTRLIVLIAPGAPLGEIEMAGRKLVTTAHLQGSLSNSNPLLTALNKPTEPKPEEVATKSPMAQPSLWALGLCAVAIVAGLALRPSAPAPAPIPVPARAVAKPAVNLLPYVQALSAGRYAEAKSWLSTAKDSLSPAEYVQLSLSLNASEQRAAAESLKQKEQEALQQEQVRKLRLATEQVAQATKAVNRQLAAALAQPPPPPPAPIMKEQPVALVEVAPPAPEVIKLQPVAVAAERPQPTTTARAKTPAPVTKRPSSRATAKPAVKNESAAPKPAQAPAPANSKGAPRIFRPAF
jgi:hypothetical protein